MVHREHGVGIIQVFRLEKGISRQRTAEIHPLRPHFVEYRNDGVDLFGTHVPAFAGVRIQATDQHMRLRDPKFCLQIVMQNPDDLAQEFRRDRIRNRFDRQMGGHQRNAHFFRRQHHHHFRTVRALFKELRMTGKRYTRFVDDAFVDGAGNQGGKFALQATVAGARKGFNDIMAVFRAELARNDRRTKGNRKKGEGTGLLQCRLLTFNVRDER